MENISLEIEYLEERLKDPNLIWSEEQEIKYKIEELKLALFSFI